MNKKNVKKVIITGAGGFLGSNLVNAFKENREYFVYALSSHGDQLQRENTTENIKFYPKDAVFSNEGMQMLQDSIVVNCAFPRNADGTEMADGLRYIQRLFNRAVECSSEAIINISSQSVYSQKREEPATDETPVCLESSYAVGKYATELMLEQACDKNAVFFTNIRLSSLIGPGFNQRIVNRLTEKALNMEPIEIVESGSRYGFFDISDAVAGIQAIMNLDSYKWRCKYNLGGGVDYSLTDIYSEIKNVFLERGLPFPDTNFETSDKRFSSSINSNNFFNDTGFTPSITLKESIKKIIDWY